jgi:serine protease Do
VLVFHKGFSIISLMANVLTVLLLPLLSVPSRAARADTPADDLIAALVEKASPAVVKVITVRPAVPAAAGPKQLADAVVGTSTATGSGFIISPSGYVATNKHVIDGAISVFVVTAGGVRYTAGITGMPSKSDMALLHIDAGHPLPFVRFGDSDKMRPGDRVIAIGSPFGFDNSVSTGIVSAVNRDIMESPFDDYIQTDAAINHGNSGGPLFNLSGEVIGMTSVIFSPEPASAGVGFALPSNMLDFVFDRLMKTGKVAVAMLPIQTQQVDWTMEQALDLPDLLGALVTSVQDRDESMLEGRILPGDVIRTFNGQRVQDPRDLARQAARSAIGSAAELVICRAGAMQTIQVVMQAWPEANPIILDNNGPRTIGLELVAGQNNNGQPIVTVASVAPTGTAAASGIQKGDVIAKIQQTPVTEPGQAFRILGVRTATNHHFAAVLVEREDKRFWLSLAVPD